LLCWLFLQEQLFLGTAPRYWSTRLTLSHPTTPQNIDPATDITRGSGLFGLVCLVYLAEVHPATFKRLLLKEEGKRSTCEYPFAVAALNVEVSGVWW
jgi:hypothetical protein